jgi:hypothetical protein
MKRMMEAQLEGFQVPHGVYYLTPDTVTQLQQNLYRFYNYTETLKVCALFYPLESARKGDTATAAAANDVSTTGIYSWPTP